MGKVQFYGADMVSIAGLAAGLGIIRVLLWFVLMLRVRRDVMLDRLEQHH